MSADESINTLKVSLVGDTGTGKTTLINKWSGESSDLKTHPTISGDIKKKQIEVEGKIVNLNVWDTAGQESFRSLVPMYIRSSAVVIIVASIVDTSTLDSISYWKNCIM